MAKKASPADAALERLREICFQFPGTEEKLSYGAPAFHVRGKLFATFADNHHGDGIVAALVKAELDEQRRLVRDNPELYFVPKYVGVKGWTGVRLDKDDTDWVELAILVENAWHSVVPKSLENAPAKPPPKPPRRPTTDPKVAKAAFAKVEKICKTFPEATVEREGNHATFAVRKKAFAYFLDNHHGDENVAVCVRVPKPKNAALVKKDPKHFFLPAYIHARGWVAMRLTGKPDWDDVAERIATSYASVAPKRPARRA